MSEVLLNLKSHQIEIVGVAYNRHQFQFGAIVKQKISRADGHSWQIAPHTNFGHKRQLLNFVLEQFCLVVSSPHIIDVKAVLCLRVSGPFQHMFHLSFHHQPHRYKHHCQNVLDDDENAAENHPILAAQCTLDDINWLETRRSQSRNQSVDCSQHQHSQYVSSYVTWCQQNLQPDI